MKLFVVLRTTVFQSGILSHENLTAHLTWILLAMVFQSYMSMECTTSMGTTEDGRTFGFHATKDLRDLRNQALCDG
jgi:hypothetical protein